MKLSVAVVLLLSVFVRVRYSCNLQRLAMPQKIQGASQLENDPIPFFQGSNRVEISPQVFSSAVKLRFETKNSNSLFFH